MNKMEISDIVRKEYVNKLVDLKEKIYRYENDTSYLGHQIYVLSQHTYDYILEHSPLGITDSEVIEYRR